MHKITIDDLLGVQFSENGPPEGHNCRSLCEEICRRAGLPFPGGDWIGDLCSRDETIRSRLAREFEELPTPEPYCLVTFTLKGDWVTHLGICLDRSRFVHITKKRGVACERLRKWEHKIDGYYRYNPRSGD